MTSHHVVGLILVTFLAASCGPDHLVVIPDSGRYVITPDQDSGIPVILDAGCLDNDIQDCYTGPSTTQNVGNCHDGEIECTAGVWGPCLGQSLPQPEDCSGRDMDCDGMPNNIPPTACYDGPPATVGVGTCNYGHNACLIDGGIQCAGETTPQPDICGGPDTECNNQPLVTTDLVDIAILIDDTVGDSEDAMGAPYFNYALQAAEDFIQQYTTTNFHYAVVLLPGASGLATPPNTISVEHYFVGGTAEVTLPLLQQSQGVDVTGEPYYTLDTLYGAVNGQAYLDWEPGARRVVLFFTGDEAEGIDFIGGEYHWITTMDVANTYRDGGVSLVLFANNEMVSSYGCNGPLPQDCVTFNLFQSAAFAMQGASGMLDDLNKTLTFPCNPDAG
jgi:hypothetical protein